MGVGSLVWLSIQDIRTFLIEDKGIEYFRSNPIMILVCLAVGVVVGLTVHFILELMGKTKQKPEMNPDINRAQEHRTTG